MSKTDARKSIVHRNPDPTTEKPTKPLRSGPDKGGHNEAPTTPRPPRPAPPTKYEEKYRVVLTTVNDTLYEGTYDECKIVISAFYNYNRCTNIVLEKVEE